MEQFPLEKKIQKLTFTNWANKKLLKTKWVGKAVAYSGHKPQPNLSKTQPRGNSLPPVSP